MRALMFGNRRNTLGSISIAVETERPVLGHLIITELIDHPIDSWVMNHCHICIFHLIRFNEEPTIWTAFTDF